MSWVVIKIQGKVYCAFWLWLKRRNVKREQSGKKVVTWRIQKKPCVDVRQRGRHGAEWQTDKKTSITF